MNDKKETEETPEPESSRLKRIVHFVLRPKIGIPLIVVMLLCAAPFMYRSYRINQLPDIDHPFDLEAFLNFEVPDDENAYVEYRQAVKLLIPMKGAWDNKAHGEIEDHGWSKATPAFQDWLEDNQPALKIWKKGTKKPNAQLTPYREMWIIDPHFDLITKLRDFSQLMHFQTAKLRYEKKYTEAWDWYRAWFRFSRHVGKNGSFTDRMIGQSMLSSMKYSLRKWIRSRDVNAAMLKKALKEIEADKKLASSIKRIIKAEYVSIENTLNSLENDDLDDPDANLEFVHTRIFYYFRGELELSRRLLKHCNSNWLTQIEKPRFLQTERIPGNYVDLFELQSKQQKEELVPPSRILSAVRSTSFGSLFVIQNELKETSILGDQVNIQCLRIAIAAEIHKREKGTYPEKLEELKPMLGEIPYDPFYSKSKRDLQYRRENGGFVVWSVGDDEKDELGAINTKWPDKMIWDDIGYRVKKIK